MKKLSNLIYELVEYAKCHALIPEIDYTYTVSRLMELFEVSEIDEKGDTPPTPRSIHEILSDALDIAADMGKINRESISECDLFDTKIMGVLTPKPSEAVRKFKTIYNLSPMAATDYFYKLALDTNYIRQDRIKKDIKWKYECEYGTLDITINLSKPEKDPAAIAAAASAPQSSYPRCALCHENEGYAGTLTKPARQNLRQMPIDLGDGEWYMQYSPYVYYNEHFILLSKEHSPMKIGRDTFARLMSFVNLYPHLFIGSNADLAIVGGSILSHEHYQGGRYTFAMDNAKLSASINFTRYPTVRAGILKWPMSVIRLTSLDREALIALSDEILAAWRAFRDEESFIIASDADGQHNTITPIARRRGLYYELDLVLRNNITTDEHPLGVYHPHSERHNIKKENIGLIEVMGLAVLPSRLKYELDELRRAILSGESIADNEKISKHSAWVSSFIDKYDFTEDNIDDILRREVGNVFLDVLRDAGVYKDTADGQAAFMRFVNSLNN